MTGEQLVALETHGCQHRLQPKKLEFVKEDSCKRKITAPTSIVTSKLAFLPPPTSKEASDECSTNRNSF